MSKKVNNIQLLNIEDNGELKPFVLDEKFTNGFIQYAIHLYTKELKAKKVNANSLKKK